MKIQTIHNNPMGKVLNECSAQGFRITTDNGDVYDIVAEGGIVTIQTRGCIVNLEFIPELRKFWESKNSTFALMSEQHCYQCDRKTAYLFDDGRCGNCTRLTPDEIIGRS